MKKLLLLAILSLSFSATRMEIVEDIKIKYPEIAKRFKTDKELYEFVRKRYLPNYPSWDEIENKKNDGQNKSSIYSEPKIPQTKKYKKSSWLDNAMSFFDSPSKKIIGQWGFYTKENELMFLWFFNKDNTYLSNVGNGTWVINGNYLIHYLTKN